LVKLRLARMGKKKQPFYRIVAMEGTAARNSQSLALVGTYDPLKARVDLDEEAALLWLKRGAQMSETVKALFRSQGILARLKGLEGQVREDALKKDKPARRRKLALAGPVEEEADEPAVEEAPVAVEAPAVEEAPVEEAAAAPEEEEPQA
jgi:small subunit ribosomal protein S16